MRALCWQGGVITTKGFNKIALNTYYLYYTVASGAAEPVTMDAQNQEIVNLTPAQVINHGFMKVLKRPAQWLIIAVLLISWSAAGVFMFDFVSDDQLTSK